MKTLYNQLITSIDPTRVKLNEPMSKHTTFRIGGSADVFVKVNTIEELKYILKVTKQNHVQVTIIGNGSNLLVRDGGIRGIVIKLDLNQIEINDLYISAESGVLLPKLVNMAAENGLTGLEFASGIPASLGGAIYMNSGAYGGQMSNIVQEITYLDETFNERVISVKDAQFDYRKSIFQKKEWIITKAVFKLEKDNIDTIKQIIHNNLDSRREKQPLNLPSAGSVFKRGNDFITAKLIDKCGLKGYTIGGAKVSEKHAGFIVNENNATAKDVLNLIEYIKAKVKDKFEKDIELEIEVIGED